MLNRRSFIASLSTSLAAATGANAATVEAAEAPELIALADKLPDYLQRYTDAREKVRLIAKEWGPQWPVPDMQIVRYGADCDTHRDILGRGIETPWGNRRIMRVQDLGRPAQFERDLRGHKKRAAQKAKTKSKRGLKGELMWAERSRAAIAPARAYWDEADRITESSGIKAAQAEQSAYFDDLQALVGQILTFEEQTPMGLAIKAQALTAWRQVPRLYQALNPDNPAWMQGLCDTLHRQTAS